MSNVAVEPRLNVEEQELVFLFALASFIHSQRRSVLTFQTSFNENENSRARGVKLHVYHQRSIC